MIHLYAFVAGTDDIPPELETVGDAGVRAVFGRSCGDTRDDVIRHGRVLESLLEHATAVLPVRFGERFADEEALEAAVAARRDELAAALSRVDGCVEVAVRVARDGGHAQRPQVAGAEYMRSRLRVVAAEEALVSSLHSVLRRHARATAVERRPSSGVLHDAGYLVDRGAIGDFTAAVERYAALYPELAVVCTGPWPPASFAEAS